MSKAYEAETSCNEDVIDSATYICAQDQFVFINQTAMSLDDTTKWDEVFLLPLCASDIVCPLFESVDLCLRVENIIIVNIILSILHSHLSLDHEGWNVSSTG